MGLHHSWYFSPFAGTGTSPCAGTLAHDFALSICFSIVREANHASLFKNSRDCDNPGLDGDTCGSCCSTDLRREMVHHSEGTRRAGSSRHPAKLSRIRTRNLLLEESRHAVRKTAQPVDPSTEFFPERPHTIRIREEKQRAVPHSIGICQLQPTAACRSAREFASPILRPANR